MPNLRNLSGQRFGRLLVTDRHETRKFKSGKSEAVYWFCICDCGTIKSIQMAGLVSGTAISCGCWNRECTGIRIQKISLIHGYATTKNKTTEYKTWESMKRRCYNPNSTGYNDWGGRGITICDRWKNSFVNFLTDMGLRPSKEYSLDRINNDGNYEPGNCRWATQKEQMNNQRPKRRRYSHKFKPDKPATMYYVRIPNPFGEPLYKIGVTNRTLKERFRKELLEITVIKTWEYSKGQDALNQEQNYLETYANDRCYGPSILSKGNQELFTRDVLRLDKNFNSEGEARGQLLLSVA